MWSPIDGFKELTKEEFSLLVDAPALITVLIAGADGEVDQAERRRSEDTMRMLTRDKSGVLRQYYALVTEIFWAKMNGFLTEFPDNPSTRNQLIAARLQLINPVLAKLNLETAYDLFQGFKALAEATAHSSGENTHKRGVGSEEAVWVELPMLDEIKPPAAAD